MMDYLLSFSSEGAAKVDAVVKQFWTGTAWRGDVCFPNLSCSSTDTMSGWFILISQQDANASLASHTNLIAAFARDSGQVVKTSLSRTGLGSLTISPLPEGAVYTNPIGAAPSQASAIGYATQTFNSNLSKLDAGSYVSGSDWYLANFFGNRATSSNSVASNSDGSTTVSPADSNGLNGQLSTAGIGGTGWVGTAFGGGGYFEATVKFDPSLVNTANGWPSFWSMAVEHLSNSSGPQWSGQASNYAHFIEADFFEYDVAVAEGQAAYGGTLHDWYGVYGVTCVGGYCAASLSYADTVRRVPAGTDWTKYHKIGFLWVPATASVPGEASFYFDDVQVGKTQTWSQFTSQSPPPSSPYTYGIMDAQHLALLIGTGSGQPLTVQSVKVWQSTTANNITQ